MIGAQKSVLIIDDSLVVRSVLERIVSQDNQFSVAGSFSNAACGLEFLKRHPVDIILLDIEMPAQSGLEALPQILEHANNAPVLILSSRVVEGAPMILQALSLGASDTLAKPGLNSYSRHFSQMLIERMATLVQPKLALNVSTRKNTIARRSHLACLAIGGSTGGLPGLYEILANLDPQIDAPIMVTQHLPEHFMPFFIDQLTPKVRRKVKLAEHDMPIKPNHIYVANGKAHLACKNVGGQMFIDLMTTWENTLHRSAVDPMMASIAKHYGPSAAAIILSGMGKDGLIGAGHFVEQSAPVYVQDVDTSIVWGMPGAIAQAGYASAVLTPSQISSYISDCWVDTL